MVFIFIYLFTITILKHINAFSHLYQSKSHAYVLETVKVFVLLYCQNDLGLLLMKLTLELVELQRLRFKYNSQIEG
jgi:hypothetical protein